LGFRGRKLSAIAYSGRCGGFALAYRRGDGLATSLEGFRFFLVPRSSGLSISGTGLELFAVSRAALRQEKLLLTSFVGRRDKFPVQSAIRRSRLARPGSPGEDDFLVGPSQRTGVSPKRKRFWEKAARSPQYPFRPHGKELPRLNRLRTRFPGLYFSGNYLNGPAIGAFALRHAFESRPAKSASVFANYNCGSSRSQTICCTAPYKVACHPERARRLRLEGSQLKLDAIIFS